MGRRPIAGSRAEIITRRIRGEDAARIRALALEHRVELAVVLARLLELDRLVLAAAAAGDRRAARWLELAGLTSTGPPVDDAPDAKRRRQALRLPPRVPAVAAEVDCVGGPLVTAPDDNQEGTG